MNSYGICLQNGSGVDKDEGGAARQFKMSTDQGNPRGMSKYVLCLANGRGTDQDETAVIRYVKMGAALGNPLSIWISAYRLRMGQGGEKGDWAADSDLCSLEDSRDGSGLNRLGEAFRYSVDVPPDKVEAVRWYRKAFDLGHATAAINPSGGFSLFQSAIGRV
jgi:TPR repeat protein